MWIDPKTNWTRDDVPLPEDFNRIEGNVRELEGNVRELDGNVKELKMDTLGAAKITNIMSESRAINANAATLLQLPASAGHRFYLISVYSPTATTAETTGILPGLVTWYLRRGKSGFQDDLFILNQSDSAATIYIKASYIS